MEERRTKILETVLAKVEERARLRRLSDQIKSELAENPTPRTSNFQLPDLARQGNRTRGAKRSTGGLEEFFDAEDIFGEYDNNGFFRSKFR